MGNITKANIEEDAALLQSYVANIAGSKIDIGVLVARRVAEKAYGDNTVNELAKVSGISPSSLYEYAEVATFLTQVINTDGWKADNARDFFDTHAAISYTHLRTAVPKGEWSYEHALDALQAITDGDPDYPDYSKALPMTVSQFWKYVSMLRGKAKPTPATGENSARAENLPATDSQFDDPVWAAIDAESSDDAPYFGSRTSVDDLGEEWFIDQARKLFAEFVEEEYLEGSTVELIVRVVPPKAD